MNAQRQQLKNIPVSVWSCNRAEFSKKRGAKRNSGSCFCQNASCSNTKDMILRILTPPVVVGESAMLWFPVAWLNTH